MVIDDVIFPNEARAAFFEPLAGRPLRAVLLRPRLEVDLARNAGRDTKDFDTSVLAETIHRLHPMMDGPPYAEAGWFVLDSSDLDLEATVDAILAGAKMS